MAKKASSSPSLQVSKSPSLPPEAASLPTTEPTAQEIADLIRQAHGGISRKMALRILTDRKQQPAG